MAAMVGSSHDNLATRLLGGDAGAGHHDQGEPAAEPLDSAELKELLELQRRRREHVIEVLAELLNGTAAWNLFVRVCWLLSQATLLLGILSLEDLAVERKGFLIIGILYSTSATMTLTKFVRDRGEARLLERAVQAKLLPTLGSQGTINALRGTSEWLMACVGSWLTAVGATLFGISQMPLQAHQRLFLLMGLFCCVSATITLAKHIRDREDGLKWGSLSSGTA